ncbi:MAG: NAD(P)-dependent oxidoreductase [Pseudomonadota bacterium]|jgi:dTDP-4-dehydrorhamnose reductase
MNILLLGANGQLGHQLSTELLALGPVRALTRAQVDLSDPVNLRAALENATALFVPDVIVNAAAYTAVDKAETDAAQATAVNAQSVGVLAEFAHSVGACLVHYSTDYVFDGSGTRPWAEGDAVAPMSVYGQTKYLGEQAIAKTCQKHLVLRTSWVVGAHGGNFLKTMLRLVNERDSLRVVADQVGVPTSTQLLAETTVALLRAMHGASDDDARWGVYHLAPAGETTWHGYAQHVVAGALARGAKLKAGVNDVHPICTAEYPLPAPRPLNSRLSTEKIQRTFGLSLPSWQQGVDAILDELIH